jgi:hypothetical protein
MFATVARLQGSEPDLRPMKVEDRSRILKAIALGRAWLEELSLRSDGQHRRDRDS